MKTEIDWQQRRDAADARCRTMWPKLQKIRGKLREAEDDYFHSQAIVIEADRHLVPITEVPKATSGKTKPSNAVWLTAIKRMTNKERRSLAMKLQGEFNYGEGGNQ